jgi:hypothetical protein
MILPKLSEEYVLHVKYYNQDVPNSLNLLIEQMTQYEPADRIQSCSLILEKLEQIIQEIEVLM